MGEALTIKVNNSSLSSAKTRASNFVTTMIGIKTGVGSFKSAAYTEASKWLTSEYISRHTRTVNESNYTINGILCNTAFEEAKKSATTDAKNWLSEKKSAYLALKDSYDEDLETLAGYLNNLVTCFETIEKQLTAIDEIQLDFNKAKDEINNSRIMNHNDDLITLNFEEVDYTTASGKTIKMWQAYVDSEIFGKYMKLCEAVNASTMTVRATSEDVVLNVTVGMMRGFDTTQIGSYVGRTVAEGLAKTRVAVKHDHLDNTEGSQEKLQKLYKEAGFTGDYDKDKVIAINNARERKEYTPEEIRARQGIRDYINEQTNAAKTNRGVYTPVPVDSKPTENNEDYRGFRSEDYGIPNSTYTAAGPQPAETPAVETPVVETPIVANTPTAHAPTSRGCGGCGGKGGTTVPAKTAVSSSFNPVSTVTPISNPIKTGNTVVPLSVTPISAQPVPKPITSVDSRFIDQQAKEIFYGRNPEQIASDRANALSIVDKAFNGEGVEEFKDVLKKGGFDDVDINVIMDNKEIAVTAYILATESKNLTDIANNLAMANNIANFDTMYDNGLSRMSLENGLSQSKLMAEVNEEVADARTNLKNARENYNNSVKKANDSIEDANKKKEEMEELKKKIVKKSGEDPSKWEDDDVEAYNKAIEKYNEANKAANDAHKEAMSNKELMDDAEQKLSETQERVAKEYLEQQNQAQQEQQIREEVPIEQPIDQPVEQPELQQVEQPVDVQPVDNDPGTIQTDDLVVDNNAEFEPVNNKGNFVSPDDVQNANSNSGSNGANAIDNVEPERKLTSDDIMDLIGNLEDVSNVSTSERTLDAVDLSSLAPDDRTIPNLGLNTNFDSSSSAGDVSTVAREINIPGGQESVLPQGNSLVGFADKAAQDANKNTDDFQNNRFNAGNFSMNAGSMNALQTESTYSTHNVSEEKPESKNKSDAPVVRDDREETVAGIKIESSDIQRHTDGVLVESSGNVASEVSEDGRSLDYVEID